MTDNRIQSFKVTCWNIEHADKLLDDLEAASDGVREKAEARLAAVRDEITALAADVLMISEGPNGEDRAKRFFERAAPGYKLVTRGSDDRRTYGMQGTDAVTGRQWIWFLLRDIPALSGSLLHLDQWKRLTEANSGGEHRAGSWDVAFPEFRDGQLLFRITRNHSHWRHPQVLLANVDGVSIEFIGCHLKSKITRTSGRGDVTDAAFFDNNPGLVADLINSRIKITTECTDVRHYIDARFAADASAPLIVLGDLNDGPGKERIERRFLYHDLISTLQGEIFFARRFLNHALFDAPEEERWSVFFRDRLDPGRSPRILLDHILFSQTFTGNRQVTANSFRARQGGGLVEHDVHHAITGTRPAFAMTSDHKPVSMHFDRRAPA